MRVDFYQLTGTPIEQVIASIAGKLLERKERLLVLARDEADLSRLDRLLWDQGRTSFLPHGLSGGADDSRQPILLSLSADAPNQARNILLADGVWRDSALNFDRAFHLFDAQAVEEARLAWKLLAGREGVERHYWAQDDQSRWVQKA